MTALEEAQCRVLRRMAREYLEMYMAYRKSVDCDGCPEHPLAYDEPKHRKTVYEEVE